MSNFDWCKYCFDKGWASESDLVIWVQAGKISEEEFNTIIEKIA